MLKVKLVVATLGLAMILPMAPTLRAQAPAAPIPLQILTAKKVFISNAGGALDPKLWSGGTAQPYNELYASIKSWEQYEIVATPENADIILQISYANPITEVIDHSLCVGNCAKYSPQFRLALLDPKTSIDLWTITEKLQAVDRNHRSADTNLVAAIGNLVADLKALTAQSASANVAK
jgi:hypothetical protein